MAGLNRGRASGSSNDPVKTANSGPIKANQAIETGYSESIKTVAFLGRDLALRGPVRIKPIREYADVAARRPCHRPAMLFLEML